MLAKTLPPNVALAALHATPGPIASGIVLLPKRRLGTSA